MFSVHEAGKESKEMCGNFIIIGWPHIFSHPISVALVSGSERNRVSEKDLLEEMYVISFRRNFLVSINVFPNKIRSQKSISD